VQHNNTRRKKEKEEKIVNGVGEVAFKSKG